ncbi:MAG: heavy metal-binding domain-containing protein, partial [Gammaproteobacteria bacterium]|nr:heavy metal-binding domain-containing protein [Gammaproteobacteria bacterium]
IGVNIDYESFGQTNGMMMVSATGTAVIIDRP